MKKLLMGMTFALVLVATWQVAWAEEAKKDEASAKGKAQVVCPIMKGDIDKSLYVDFEGKRIYVCCKGCIAAVKKDPAKYIRQLEAEGIVLDSVPANAAEGKPAAKTGKESTGEGQGAN